MRTLSTTFIATMMLTSGLAACGSSEPAPPPPVKDTVFGDLVDTERRAKEDTEKAMAAHKQLLEDSLKKQEGE